MRDVAVIGVGLIKWGELWEKSLRSMFAEAAQNAIKDAGVDHVDSLYVGCMTSGMFVDQEHIGALCADYAGLGPIPATRVESACASGAVAMKLGVMEVASGMSDIVMVGGVEKMTDVDGAGATYALAAAADQEYEVYNGVTFPGLYAMMARAHMQKYGTTRKQLAHVPVKSHDNGFLNPYAQYQMKITVDQVIAAVKIADPLTILDCSPITDGAAAVIVCPLTMAKKMKRRAVKVSGVGHATDTLALHQRKDITWLDACERSAQAAYKMAGVGPSDIDLAEVHDCFSISEIMAIEALGFVEKGKGGPATEAGETAIGGRIPINTSGGLKSKGHPVGATGVAQVCEVVTQLRGESGPRQVKGAKRGLTQNMGGTCASSVVHILEVA